MPRVDWKRLIRFVRLLVGNFSEHRMAIYASALAYRGLFCLFPFMLIIVVLSGALGSPDPLDQLAEEVRSSQQVPEQLRPVVEQGREQVRPIEEIAEQARREARGELLFFGFAIAMWSVSDLAGILADAFNRAYGATTTRRRWRTVALSLAFGPFLALTVVVSTGLMIVGPQVVERVADTVGLRESFVVLWAWLRFPVALVLLMVVLAFIYRYGSAANPRFRSVVVGAFLAVVVWAIASIGFSVYLANFADYGVTYGSLGAAVGLLLYLYISASIVLAGAEINAIIYRSAAPAPERAEERPAPDVEVSAAREEELGEDHVR